VRQARERSVAASVPRWPNGYASWRITPHISRKERSNRAACRSRSTCPCTTPERTSLTRPTRRPLAPDAASADRVKVADYRSTELSRLTAAGFAASRLRDPDNKIHHQQQQRRLRSPDKPVLRRPVELDTSLWPSAKPPATPASHARWDPRRLLRQCRRRELLRHAQERELVHRRSWPTRRELTSEVFEYIEGFYNRIRRHSTLAMLSPLDFENTTLLTPGASLAASRLAHTPSQIIK
jgi:hypothetical protein